MATDCGWDGGERRQSDVKLARELGGLQERMRAVEASQKTQGEDIKTILTVLSEARGGWKALMIVGGVSGAIGALIAKVLPFLPMKP